MRRDGWYFDGILILDREKLKIYFSKIIRAIPSSTFWQANVESLNKIEDESVDERIMASQNGEDSVG